MARDSQEGGDRVHAVEPQGRPAPDIAVAGPGAPTAAGERDDAAGKHRLRPARQAASNRSRSRMTCSAASVITTVSGSRWRARTAATAMAGPEVAPVRLEHDGGLDPELLRLVAGEEAEVGRGHHDGAANRAASATRISAC